MEKFICGKICSYENKVNKTNYPYYYSDILEEENNDKIACRLSKEIYNYENNIIENMTIYEKASGLVYGVFLKNNKEVFVIFKGTSSFSNVISDINLAKFDDSYDIPGKFHKGFHDLILKNNVCEKIYNDIPLSATKIYITGHSLGGALATVFYSFVKKCNIDSELITFGSPRVGDSEFAKYLNENSGGGGGKMKRYVNGSDIICKLPVLGYHHVDTKINIGTCKFLPSVEDHHIDNYIKNLK